MPVIFIVSGIVMLFLIFFAKKSFNCMLSIISLLALMLSYIIAPVEIGGILALNTLMLFGVVMLIVSLLCSGVKISINNLLIVTLVGVIYVVIYKLDSIYYALFNILPLFSIISIFCIVLTKDAKTAVFNIVLCVIVTEIINVIIADIENLYYVMFGIDTITLMGLSIGVVALCKIMLTGLRRKIYAKE